MIKNVNIDDELLINEIQSDFSEIYKQNNELKNEFINNPYTKVLVFVENDKIIGLIHINDIYDRYEINNIYVLDEYRKKGIASQLMDSIIKLGKDNGIINITLEVKKDNISAIKLYKKYGFVEKAIRKNYYNGTDGILMEKEMM